MWVTRASISFLNKNVLVDTRIQIDFQDIGYDPGCTVGLITNINNNNNKNLPNPSFYGSQCLVRTVPRWGPGIGGFLKSSLGASLVAQWLRIHLPVQGTRVQALIQEDPTCRRATKPVCHNYWAWALEPASHNYWAHVPQLLKPAHLEPVLHNKRSHRNEKPAYRNEDPTQPKINKLIKKKKLSEWF